jgi:hypothetical protein
MHYPGAKNRQGISRRVFHRHILTLGSSLAAGSLLVGAGRSAQAASSKFPPGKYVDFHTHLGQPHIWRGAPSPEAMIRWMDANLVSQVVVLPLISPEGWYYPLTSDWVLEQTKPHRDRLIPFCDVDPRTDYLRGYQGILDLLKGYVDRGAKGLGEHKCGVRIDDPRNIVVFRAAESLGLPILLHMDPTINIDRKGLPGLQKVLEAVPGTCFFGHGPTFWSSTADDTLDRLMDKYPNIYGDLSAGSGLEGMKRAGREFCIRRADRLVFGTDYLSEGQAIPQFELYASFHLPPDVQAKIFRDNARRILKLG